ncbi:MAG TPA: hypothetical protein VNW92_02790 [Polyangiaceae bacterium]|nr:hypothetical protein [Polyangiaceae bacterium]
MLGKLRHTAVVISTYARKRELDARLERLRACGLAETVPTPIQLALGGFDMQRFYIVPASNEYHHRRQLNYAFCQVLRFVDNPVVMVDPLGLASKEPEIIEHLVQSFHGHPTYDLQLLTGFEGGLDALEQRLNAIVSGVEPRSAVSRFINDTDYHRRLLTFVREFRADPARPPPVLEAASAEGIQLAEEVFGTVKSVMRYCASRPKTWRGALLYVLTQHELEPALQAQ